jgi:hypothetical protein
MPHQSEVSIAYSVTNIFCIILLVNVLTGYNKFGYTGFWPV